MFLSDKYVNEYVDQSLGDSKIWSYEAHAEEKKSLEICNSTLLSNTVTAIC